MNIGNYARSSLAALAIPLFVPLSGLEQIVQSQSIIQSGQPKSSDYKASFWKIRGRILELEHSFDWNQGDGTSKRAQIFEDVGLDVRQLLYVGYGIGLPPDDVFTETSAVFSFSSGFVLSFSIKGDGLNSAGSDILFHRDQSISVKYVKRIDAATLDYYFAIFKPNRRTPKPLSEILVDDAYKDQGLHYFGKEDFDKAYSIVSELTREFIQTDREKDWPKFLFLRQQLEYIQNDLLNIHGQQPYRGDYLAIRAASGRILIPLKSYMADTILVIWPNRNPTITTAFRDRTFKVEELPQVMSGSRY